MSAPELSHAHTSVPSPSPETRQNPTNPDTFSRANRPLSQRQLSAIPLIIAGQTDAEIAQTLDVSRQTVCDWRNHHPLFIAELNRQRHQTLASAADRYNRLLTQSMDLIERFALRARFVGEEEIRVAQSILRSATPRLLALSSSAPTKPDEIRDHLLSQGLSPAPDDTGLPPQGGEHEDSTQKDTPPTPHP